MKISKGMVHGVERWVLNYKDVTKYRRKFFASKASAEAEMERLKIDQRNLGAHVGAMSLVERAEWGAIKLRLDAAGIPLREMADFFFKHRSAAPTPLLADAIAPALKDWARRGVSDDYLVSVRELLPKFAAHFPGRKVSEITPEHIHGFLESRGWAVSTRNGALGRLRRLFAFFDESGWLVENPTEKVRPLPERDKAPPIIFTVEQARCLLHAAQRTNARWKMLPYFALGLFCGLRPQYELGLMEWNRVFLDESFCAVDAATSKGEQHRNVTLPDCAIAFLKLGGQLPAPSEATVKRARAAIVDEANRLAKARGVPPMVWAQDVMRHTFASHHYARAGGHAEDTKREMGHSRSSRELFDHYRARVRPAEADAFWKIKPE